VFPDSDLDRVPDQGELLASGSAGGQLQLRSEQFSPYLSYRPAGQLVVDDPEQTSGEFIVCDTRGAAAARVIAILPAGLPRLSETRLDGAAPECPRD